MPKVTYWHGGQRGLKAGGYILPASESGARGTLTEYAAHIPGGHVARRDRVYVTTDKQAAVMYAAVHPSGGCIYRVEPEGELIEDPDCSERGLSFECSRARILGVTKVTGYQRAKVVMALMS